MLKKNSLLIPFFTSLFFFLTPLKLLAFAPFLVIVYSRATFLRSLVIAISIGYLNDLFSSEYPLGVHALIYALTTILVYRLKWRLFVDKPIGLITYTFFFSATATVLTLITQAFFGNRVPMPFKSIFTEVIVMPFFDGLYAFVCYTCPKFLYYFIKKQWFHFKFYWEKIRKRKHGETKQNS